VVQVIEGLTEESLDGHAELVEGPGWPESRSYPVCECLLVVLNEGWEHWAVRRTGPGRPGGRQFVAVPLDLPAELVGYLAWRRPAKNSRTSATSRSGVSSAAKWPPASMSLQWTMLLLCSA
jgi:hypothetical protein